MVYALDFSKFARIALTDASGSLTQEGLRAMLELQRRTGTILGVFAAASVTFTPSGGLASTNVQGAITELDTEKQPIDATLTALAGVTTAADNLVYATGADTFAATPFTAFARTLLDDADAAAMRSTLGLVIGTDVQAQNAELSAIAGLTSAADRLPYFTGAGTASLATFTAAGRALVDDADEAAQRTTLGLGTIATQDASAVAITGGTAVLTTVRTPGTVVASLPSAATAGDGARAFVTDATATTFHSVVAGGGANKVPVVSDGTDWLIG